MKKSDTILFLIALSIGIIALFASCENEVKPNPNIHYINMDCIIVEKISSVGSGRLTSKAFLIRGVKDTTLYSEYVSLRQYVMQDSVYYKHEVGDTLHFDYIKKSRFFKK
jgi:hypothetical protein